MSRKLNNISKSRSSPPQLYSASNDNEISRHRTHGNDDDNAEDNGNQLAHNSKQNKSSLTL